MPTADSGFRIGSITKLFTALMTLMLRDSKQLQSLDANIAEYQPDFSIINPFKTNRGITFRQLMSHMSGLPRESPCANIFVTGCNLSEADIYKNLANIELMYPPGQQPTYSNLGFGLLGRVLEKITNVKWEDSVKKMVFDQLGMTTSGNTFTADDIKKLAIGYYANGSPAGIIIYNTLKDVLYIRHLSYHISCQREYCCHRILGTLVLREHMWSVLLLLYKLIIINQGDAALWEM